MTKRLFVFGILLALSLSVVQIIGKASISFAGDCETAAHKQIGKFTGVDTCFKQQAALGASVGSGAVPQSHCALGEFEGKCIVRSVCTPSVTQVDSDDPAYRETETMRVLFFEDGGHKLIYEECVGGPSAAASVEELATKAFFDLKPAVPAPGVAPEGVTLCNLDTNFVSGVGVQELTMTLNGRAVTLRAIPKQFDWDFGDGHTYRSDHGGDADYERLVRARERDEDPLRWGFVVHQYPTKGEYNPNVTVRFGGEFSVEGAPFRTIDGTVSATSPTVPLQVKEARAELVDPNLPQRN